MKNKDGMWVITNPQGEYLNPRGGFQEDFRPSKHLFYDRTTVLAKLYFYGDVHGALTVREVTLNPTFTPIVITPEELKKCVDRINGVDI